MISLAAVPSGPNSVLDSCAPWEPRPSAPVCLMHSGAVLAGPAKYPKSNSQCSTNELDATERVSVKRPMDPTHR